MDGLDIEVHTGECFGLLGPNGAGKTTTIEMLEGLHAPDSGTIEIHGYRWGTGHDRTIRDLFGVQLQETKLAERLTVEETVRLFRSFYTNGCDINDLIELVGLEKKRRAWVMHLSGGQKQRLAIACALAGNPALLFLDEPTNGLDPQSRLKLWEVIEQFRAGGGTVLLTTHYMDEAAHVCDRVGVIDRGRMIALGTPSALIKSLGAEQIIEFQLRGETPEASLTALPGVLNVHATEDGYALTVSNVGATLPLLLAELERQRVELLNLTTHQATLQDVFVALTGNTLRDE
ncbi:MAG TPA: ABC transporter ATP-binding protein [Pyrinomonadaceae bacterium]